MELVIIDCLIINYLFTISQVSQTPSTTGIPPQPTQFLKIKLIDGIYWFLIIEPTRNIIVFEWILRKIFNSTLKQGLRIST